MASEQTTAVLSDTQNANVSFATSEIKGMRLTDGGALTINLANDKTVTIENFKALADSGAILTTADGRTIDARALFETLAKDMAPVSIVQPAANAVVEYTLLPGRKYELSFDGKSAHAEEKDGALIITFDDGGQIIITNFNAAMDAGVPPQMTYNGDKYISLDELLNTLKLAAAIDDNMDGNDAEIRKDSNDMAALAKELAGVEPAAGEGTGGDSAHGYGFQSSVDAADLGALPPIGPIGPTALAFGLPQFTDQTFMLVAAEAPLATPGLERDDAQVYEDGSVTLDLAANSNGGATVVMTITVSGIPAGWTVAPNGGAYDSATGTWTYTNATGATSFVGGPTLSPPHNSDADLPNLTITVINTDTATGDTTSINGPISIVVDAVADAPNLSAAGGVVDEDTAAPLNINLSLVDTDGSEEITSVIISRVPDGFTLSSGRNIGGGQWEISPTDVAGLTITPPLNFSGDLTWGEGTEPLLVTVTVTETNKSDADFDLTNDSVTVQTEVSVGWRPVADEPGLEVASAQVKEDGSVFIPVSATMVDTDGSEHMTLTVAGVPAGWALSGTGWSAVPGVAGTYSYSTIASGDGYNGGFTLTPPANSDVDLLNLQISATSREGQNNDTAVTTRSINVVVDAVADVPTIDTPDNSGDENTAVGVNITAGLTDNDGSEVIEGYVITGVPDGFSFNQGTNLGGGVWSLTPAQISGLTISSTPNFVGSINLVSTVLSTEDPVSDGEFDSNDNDNSASDPFVITWNPIAHPPTVSVNNGVDDVIVKEDGMVDVRIDASFGPRHSSDAVMTVTITGIDPSWGTVHFPGNFVNTAPGTWTYTLPANTELHSWLQFIPAPNRDIDLTGITVTASVFEPRANMTANSVPDTFNVITDAVADVPNIIVNGTHLNNDGVISPLNISTSVNDTDGSEVIEVIRVTGLSDGLRLTAGTEVSAGVWELTTGQLAGLGIVIPSTAEGHYFLTVESVAYEQNTSGTEVDISDNRAIARGTLGLTVVDSVPIITQPQVSVVDETGAGNDPFYVSADGRVSVNFGADAPGSLILADGFTSSTPLFSNRTAVTVVRNGDTITGTNDGGRVFTLVLQPDGSYRYEQFQTLDHPDTQNPDDVIRLDFVVRATDSDGDVVTGTITVNVHDDAPTAYDDIITYGNTPGVNAYNGNVMSNDTMSNDYPNMVTRIEFSGQTYNVPADGSNVTVVGAYGTLEINEGGSYRYVLKPGATGQTDTFTYTLTDNDGDSSTARLGITGHASELKIGRNGDDQGGSTTTYQVGGGPGVITGGSAADILVGDTGGTYLVPQTKDYNVVMMLDVSGSMGSALDPNSRISLLIDAVQGLMGNFHSYSTGSIQVHLIPFDTLARTAGTFTVTTDAGYNGAVAFLENMGTVGGGFTNYEAPLQSAISWLQGSSPTAGAETYTYFITDGEPNRYMNASGVVTAGTVATSMAEITGFDGTNEVATIKSLSHEVVGVGISIDAAIANVSVIDSDGSALNVRSPSELNAALQSLNPLNGVASVGSDDLVGNGGNDLIYGDALYTDALATAMGLSTRPGSGWEVFERLEAGQSAIDPSWSRQDTIEYIVSHARALSGETLSSGGAGRTGGHDRLDGGAGDDFLFGQEGNDILIGGGGADYMVGGTGIDQFVFRAGETGVDHIADFKVSEGDRLDFSQLISGYDATTMAIGDFVHATTVGGNTVIAVDANGTAGGASFTNVVILDGITNTTVNDLVVRGALLAA